MRHLIINARDHGRSLEEIAAREAQIAALPVANPLTARASRSLLALLAPEFPAGHEAVSWEHGSSWTMAQALEIEDMLVQLSLGRTRQRAERLREPIRRAITLAREGA